MTMKSMAMTKAEQKKENREYPVPDRSIPWGLEIRLDDTTLKKLGVSVEDLSSGATVQLMGKAKVESVSTCDVNGKKSNSVSLQITHLEVLPVGTFEDAFKARVAKEKK